MPYIVAIEDVRRWFPQLEIVSALTPSEQKAAFHVRSEGRDLCLKLISPSFEPDRVGREIAALQQLSSPNVVKLEEYAYSSKGGVQLHYAIEEFVDGVDLDADLATAPWARPRVASCFGELCNGLEALRVAGVVHRDLKPHNVRVRPNGNPVLIDFGLARILTLPDITSTTAGAAIGTPAYFAPEQFVGTKHDIDHRTDLFALGILMYQALTGDHPFYQPGQTLAQIKHAVCEGDSHLDIDVFKALPKRWRVLLSSLLSRVPAKRPVSAATVKRLLEGLRGV